MAEIEWRVWYTEPGARRPTVLAGFPEPDLNWCSYLHSIRPYQVVRWESRFVRGTDDWRTKEQGGPQPCYEIANQHGQQCLRAKDHHGLHSPYGDS